MKTDKDQLRFLPCGDSALTVEFSREINEETNKKIHYLTKQLTAASIRGVQECIPAFCSLTVFYDPLLLSARKLEAAIRQIAGTFQPKESSTGRLFLIPVCYEGDYAPDMEDVCTITGLSSQEIIRLHTSVDYRIYMLGFLPGFPYLGGMDPRLEAPRLLSPRTLIPAGSVGIGGKQTGIYPLASPGGWRLIGRTPVILYDPHRQVPIVYETGDSLRFYPITAEEFQKLSLLKQPPMLSEEGKEV